MGRLLARYVLATFLVSALVAGGAVVCLFVMGDCFQHFRDFMEHARETDRSLAAVIVSYYLHQMPLLFYFLAPVVACAAAGASVTKLLRENEIVVVKASGLSLYRACLPILAGAAGLGMAMAADQELLIPRVARTIAENAQASLHRGDEDVVWDIFRVDQYRRAFQIQKYHRRDHRMENVTITCVDANGLKTRVIQADQASWDVGGDGVPQIVLSGGVEYGYGEGDPLAGRQSRFGERGLTLKTSLTEEAILAHDVNPLLLNSREVEAHLAAAPPDKPTAIGGRLMTALWARLPDCFSPLALAMLSVALVLWNDTRNYGWGMALALSAWVGYFVLSYVCGLLGSLVVDSQWVVPPPVAAWIPLAVAGTAGLVLYLRIRT